MNSKAIKRQLLAAIAMVLVAAIALGSSTYAWFVQAGSVTATGMQVNLSSEGGLVIRYGGDGDAWGVTATANMEAPKDLLPTSTKDFTKWTYAQAASSAKFDMNESTYADVTDKVVTESGFVKTSENKYAIMEEFYIRSSNPSQVAKGLKVSAVTVTRGSGATATQDINNAMKVGLAWSCANGQSGNLIMSPLNVSGTRTTTYNFVDPSTKQSSAVTMKTAGSDATLFANNVVVPAGTDSPVKVQVYIWFEGQDTHLYSDNVNATEDLKISIMFEADSYAAQTSAGGSADAPNLVGQTAVSEGSQTIGSNEYFPIPGMTLSGKQLYAGAAGAITKDSVIYTLDNETTPTQATVVTTQCTMPA